MKAGYDAYASSAPSGAMLAVVANVCTPNGLSTRWRESVRSGEQPRGECASGKKVAACRTLRRMVGDFQPAVQTCNCRQL